WRRPPTRARRWRTPAARSAWAAVCGRAAHSASACRPAVAWLSRKAPARAHARPQRHETPGFSAPRPPQAGSRVGLKSMIDNGTPAIPECTVTQPTRPVRSRIDGFRAGMSAAVGDVHADPPRVVANVTSEAVAAIEIPVIYGADLGRRCNRLASSNAGWWRNLQFPQSGGSLRITAKRLVRG